MKQDNKINRAKRPYVAIILFGLFSAIAFLVGCSRATSPSVKATAVPLVTNDTEHNLYFREGCALIKPYMRLTDVPEKPTDGGKAKSDIAHGIALLNAVIAYNTKNWSAWWIIGKGYQALHESDKACAAFGKSYAIQSENPDVAREYMVECLNVGRNKEAVSVAEHAVSLSPNDAGLYANLALAYTVSGRLTDAQSAIKKSLQINPGDQITLSLQKVIQEIVDGKRPQPHTMREIEGP